MLQLPKRKVYHAFAFMANGGNFVEFVVPDLGFGDWIESGENPNQL